MSRNEEGEQVEIKVKRTRRRLYHFEPGEEETPVEESPAEPSAAEGMESVREPDAAAGEEDGKEPAATAGKEGDREPGRRERHDKALSIIKNHAIMSMAPALLPMPLVDMAVSAGIQLRMLKKLSQCYEVAFSRERAKAFIGALIGGYHVGLFTRSVLKLAPVIGQATGAAAMAVLSPATTYAVGAVFRKHFESGGTFLDFSASKARAHFDSEVKKTNLFEQREVQC